MSMENETEVYKRVNGLNLTPKFLGHVTCQGAVIGYVLEYLEDARTTTAKDMYARIKAVKKLHALGITHGCAHHQNFLRQGKDVLMIDFEESKFDDEATQARKGADIRRIRAFKNDGMKVDDDDDEWVDEIDWFFEDFHDDEINWTEDSTESEEDLDSD
ncbi:hypothetical protein NPX13_g3382 [Xylaria arbuscula]|uniref:Protein kinase domain-containing protein n=1 Tax=Xylaria arbuscula TaxID=114810 RepID=A0A9W8NIM2_9PEZI|nr:hypothetical protein NPX13_g3382 [Xylaria arbuscula]